jgi:putative FmdB family regulatory protein
MPLYEYECEAGHHFEKILKFSDPPIVTCPTCGKPVHKLVSSPAFQFKGTGWYITDYARKDKDTPETKDTKEAKETKESAESKGSSEKESKGSKDSSTKETPAAKASDTSSSTTTTSSSVKDSSKGTAKDSSKAP